MRTSELLPSVRWKADEGVFVSFSAICFPELNTFLQLTLLREICQKNRSGRIALMG